MASSNFVDAIRVFVRAGNGGSGSVHFRRTRFNPSGGPDGGNGGRGGSVFLIGNPHMNTLLHLRFRKHIVASHGKAGSGQKSDGSSANDIIIPVPLGTVIKDATTEEYISEVTQADARYCLAKGGRGGMGNAYFKSSVRQTPKFAQPGEKGEVLEALLELKLMADVGLVGRPNAGKSTLLSRLSAAEPKIGDYAFTTLTPQLGVVDYYDQNFVMADIPGLIQGASQGKGLGIRFLRHIERTRILLYTIPADDADILGSYKMLQKELQAHGIFLEKKITYLAITKGDLLEEREKKKLQKSLEGTPPYLIISAVANQGLKTLKKELFYRLQKELNHKGVL